jgi:exopolyphosphatase/guanosine-5'-triphosphate,3'-diphosphate pyrophosphatase
MPRRAVIDIGTNSVKLLVAEVDGPRVVPVLECGEQTRLGQDFYRTHHLTAPAVARTAATAARFAARAQALGASQVSLIATSAAREARNPEDLRAAVRRACGLELAVISGEQEADLAFRGVRSDPRLAGKPLGILDVGGGSTEVVLGGVPPPVFRRSYALGAVRLLESMAVEDPPTDRSRAQCADLVRACLHEQVESSLGPALAALADPAELVGTGGTASVLGAMQLGLTRFDREALEALDLSLADVERWSQRLWQLPLAERQRIPGLPPERADVILTGVGIYLGMMERFGWRSLRISTRGLRFGAVLEAETQPSTRSPDC